MKTINPAVRMLNKALTKKKDPELKVLMQAIRKYRKENKFCRWNEVYKHVSSKYKHGESLCTAYKRLENMGY